MLNVSNQQFGPQMLSFIRSFVKVSDNFSSFPLIHFTIKLSKFIVLLFVKAKISSITHICRIKGCGGAGWPPPPIIFERLKLPQQIIYRRKENLSESPNHQKYWENILVSRFYEQFSRNRRNLGHFRKFEKISNS